MTKTAQLELKGGRVYAPAMMPWPGSYSLTSTWFSAAGISPPHVPATFDICAVSHAGTAAGGGAGGGGGHPREVVQPRGNCSGEGAGPGMGSSGCGGWVGAVTGGVEGAWVGGCVGAWVRGGKSAWVLGCVGAWVRGCVGSLGR